MLMYTCENSCIAEFSRQILICEAENEVCIGIKLGKNQREYFVVYTDSAYIYMLQIEEFHSSYITSFLGYCFNLCE